MRDILDKLTPVVEISEKHTPVEEDVLGSKNDLLLDLEKRSKSKHHDDISPKGTKKVPDVLPRKQRDISSEFQKFMSEEELDEANNPLRHAAMAAALTGAMAGGGKAVQIHNLNNLEKSQAEAEFISSHAPQKVGDIVVGKGDWAYGGSVEKPEEEKPKSKGFNFNPFRKKAETPEQPKPTAQSEKVSKEFIENMNYLTATMWGEARGEGVEGMRAVGHVIMNRVQNKRWGDTIKEVSLARKQFSCWNPDDQNYLKIKHMLEVDNYIQEKPEGFEEWFEEFKTTETYPEYLKWKKAKKVAMEILNGKSEDMTNGSLFYHTTAVNPYWNRGQTVVAKIGNHVFYRTDAKA